MSDPRPIGIFDSGVGGLAVLTKVRRLLPRESFVYLADQRWAPYGERTLDQVRARAVQISGQLIEAGVKMVVVACNSASAAALRHLRDTYPEVPFVGMEPAVKPAAVHSRSGVIGVLATAATFQGELFASVVDRHANGARVLTGAASDLAGLVEQGRHESTEARAALSHLLKPMVAEGMDTLVIGCTHYSFLRAVIRDIVGDEVTVIDPAAAVARQVRRVLRDGELLAPDDEPPGVVQYHTTLDPEGLASAIRTLTGEAVHEAPTLW